MHRAATSTEREREEQAATPDVTLAADRGSRLMGLMRDMLADRVLDRARERGLAPLATVVRGLLTTTFLTLFLLPVLYAYFGKSSKRTRTDLKPVAATPAPLEHG